MFPSLNRLNIRAIAMSDVGSVRTNNEDSARFTFLDGSATDFVAAIADGMGGYERGEVASAMMTDAVCDSALLRRGCGAAADPKRRLAELLISANSRIRSAWRQTRAPMGTTCSLLLIEKRKVWCAHVGDSRIYRLNKRGLQRLTTDQTVVAELLRQGRLTAQEAAAHPDRNVLTQAVGTTDNLRPDVFAVKRVRRGDRFLLCSDGLHSMADDADIEQRLAMPSLRRAAASLIELAIERGGYDNVSLIIVEINDKKNREDIP